MKNFENGIIGHYCFAPIPTGGYGIPDYPCAEWKVVEILRILDTTTFLCQEFGTTKQWGIDRADVRPICREVELQLSPVFGIPFSRYIMYGMAD
jgi:hypothetical protein